MDAPVRYPVEWIDRFQLARGEWITLRPVLPQDDVQEREFVAHGLTSQSRYLRFQVGLNELPEALTQAFTHIDYHDHFALVAESFGAGSQTQVGDARFVRVGGAHDVAEFGMAVADAWHGFGIGRRLLCMLVAAARAQGVAQLYGDVLRGNAPMLALARANGFGVQRHPDNATLVRVQRTLAVPVTPESIAMCA
ncbi:MAG: GNAT family N-acetyltransferase [Burkholderiaceae bacterium]|nr:MAG: GNAT family N-acetyltransferase [Burkholderiaceae bacterium]